MTEKKELPEGPSRRQAARRILKEREQGGDPKFRFGVERVDVERVGEGNGPFQVRKKHFHFQVDEPPERGGTDSAPNPLAFWELCWEGC